MNERTITIELTEYELRTMGRSLREYKAHLMKLPTDWPLLNETAGERVYGVQGIHDKVALAFVDVREWSAADFMVDVPSSTKVNEVD